MPEAYYRNIYEIDYNNLLKKGYKNIFFDVDNTLISYQENSARKENKELFDKLKKMGFNLVIVSNSMSDRVLNISKSLDVKGYYTSMKPLKKTYKKIEKDYDKNTCVFIGDQFMTDVLGAKRTNFKIILVDRISNDEPIYTKFWRFFEKILLKKYKKKKVFEIGNYYDNLK